MTQTIDIKTQADFARMFASVVEAFGGLRWGTWLDGEMRRLEAEHAKFFAKAEDPAGKKWAPLAPSTVKRKGHATILVDKVKLKPSLTQPQSEYGYRYPVDEWPKASLVFGTLAPYSGFQETATDIKPARIHVGVNTRYVDGMAGRAVDHAFKGIQ